SRLAMGKVTLHREPFDLSELVAHTVRTWEQSQRVAPGRIRIDARTAWIHADRARIEQVLANLLDNAVKFSPAHTVIHVAVREDDGQGLLEVSDEGEGISPDVLPRLFDLFVQGGH